MPTPAEMEEKLWKALKSDRTVMLSLAGVDNGLSQPMTAQLEDDARGPIWIFTARDTDLAEAMGERHRAVLHFVAKGHDLFAALQGELATDDDPATIDRLWNPYVAAWFEGGQDDPNLQLLRFEPDEGQVWLNENSLLAGAKLLLGRDPKREFRDQTARLPLS